MKKFALLLLALLVTGCPKNQPDPVGPKPGPIIVKDTDLCGAAKDNLEEMQCMNRDGTKMWINNQGEGFDETCRRLQEEGGIFLDPKCVSEAQTCDEAKACPPSEAEGEPKCEGSEVCPQ